MRLFATSDLHTDYKENFRWLQELSDTEYRDDVLIVAGDVSDRLEIIRETLLLLRSKFRQLLFTPGNHELWVRGENTNSLEKFQLILDLCNELGIETKPVRLENLWVVPLFSWYDGVYEPKMTAWADFHFCKWPADTAPLADYFLRLNEPHLKSYDAPVITFSHFIPRSDLLPPKEYLRISWLSHVSVCAALDSQIRQLNSRVHICGHTHTTFDRTIDDVRYVQNAVKYPKERRTPSSPIKLIYPY
ncbi:MAG TPA: metallophosphoesterase [Pyrinomonadaceae bacterium]|nr:metallophosphoesterase [Pyrinomonadaceae bacterium]